MRSFVVTLFALFFFTASAYAFEPDVNDRLQLDVQRAIIDIKAADPGDNSTHLHGINLPAKNVTVTYNKVLYNTIEVAGPDVYGIQIIVLNPDNPDPTGDVEYAKSLLHDNIIRFNDLRGTTKPFSIIPPGLEEANAISNNLI